jgi:hypothetical protein
MYQNELVRMERNLFVYAQVGADDKFHRNTVIGARCNTLQHTATHCNTLQHTSTQQV